MASETENLILIKRNNVSGVIPRLSSLELGELGINTVDGKLFTKTVSDSVSSIVSFLNSNDYPYTLNHYYSSVNFNYGNNTVNQVYASVLGGYNNDITGGGSSVINGEDNDIAGDFSLIGSGLKNKISVSGDDSFIAAGSGNLINHPNVFTLGTNITSHAPNFTYVNNLSVLGKIYGDGSEISGIISGGNGIDTGVRDLSSNWQSTYTTVSSNSAKWDSNYTTVQSYSATWGTSSNTTLISAVTSDVEVGGIEIAQIVPQNTSFQQFVETLLTKIYYPTITAPSATMSSSIGTNVEAGTEGITLTVNLNRGAITGKTVASIWDPNTLQDYRSGTATQYIILGVNNGTTSAYTSATAIIQEGTNTFNGNVTYATGPQPVDSKGQNYLSPLASNTIAVSTPVYGRRKAFYGVDNTAANSSDIRSLAGSLLNPSNGSTFTISIPIGTANVVFAYPSSLRNVNSVLYQEGFDADVKANFTQTTVSVEGANGYSATNYKVYKYTPVAAFTQAATYNVTI